MELSKETKFTLSTETIATLAIGLVGATGLYYTLKGDIEAAKELPKPAVTAEEYQLKDQLLRTTVDNIEKKVDKIDQRLEKIEERLMK